MASFRNVRPGGGKADRLLDAARESILAFGWKRTTLTDVASRAGVSRMTVYRTYPDMPTLFGDLMTREWAEVAAAVLPTQEDVGDGADAIAASVVRMVTALRENDLLRRIVDVDPELLLPYLLDRPGRSQAAVLRVLAERIAEAQAAGGVRRGEPALLAKSCVLAAHGFVLSTQTMTDEGVTAAALDAELAELVRRYLA